jgi:hypothetical protein
MSSTGSCLGSCEMSGNLRQYWSPNWLLHCCYSSMRYLCLWQRMLSSAGNFSQSCREAQCMRPARSIWPFPAWPCIQCGLKMENGRDFRLNSTRMGGYQTSCFGATSLGASALLSSSPLRGLSGGRKPSNMRLSGRAVNKLPVVAPQRAAQLWR